MYRCWNQFLVGAAIITAAALLGTGSPSVVAFAQTALALNPALLEPQPEPDCEFKSTEPKPDALQKLDYERQCYRHAEINVRHRLELLQHATASASLLPRSTIKALQEALKRQDSALKTDGVLGKGTRAAIRRYQAQRGLQVTGDPDAATLSRLGVPSSAN
jgi:Putative peptidoglycan binding domain